MVRRRFGTVSGSGNSANSTFLVSPNRRNVFASESDGKSCQRGGLLLTHLHRCKCVFATLTQLSIANRGPFTSVKTLGQSSHNHASPSLYCMEIRIASQSQLLGIVYLKVSVTNCQIEFANSVSCFGTESKRTFVAIHSQPLSQSIGHQVLCGKLVEADCELSSCILYDNNALRT